MRVQSNMFSHKMGSVDKHHLCEQDLKIKTFESVAFMTFPMDTALPLFTAKAEKSICA